MMVMNLNRTPMPMTGFDEVKVFVDKVGLQPEAIRKKRDPTSKTMLRMGYNGSGKPAAAGVLDGFRAGGSMWAHHE